MNINSIAPLLTTTLQSMNQSNNRISNESFAKMLTEVMLQLENSEPSSLFDSSSLSTLFSSLGLDPNLNLPVSSIDNVLPVSSVETKDNISASDLNQHLKGVLSNTGDIFLKAGEMYQVSPSLLASIAMHETGNGTSNAARFKYNVAGMMGKNGLKTYHSIEESIMDMARNLKNNYFDEGKTSIADIGAKYAPIGASNDPSGLNNNWVTGVQRYFNTITNKTDFA